MLCATALMLFFVVAGTNHAEAKTTYKKISVVSKFGNQKYSYNKSGLISKAANINDKISKITYKYSGTKVKSIISVANIDGVPITQNMKVSYSKKGRLSDMEVKTGTARYPETIIFKTDKKGRVNYCRTSSYIYNITYDKKSRISKILQNPVYVFSNKEEYVYKYDAKGNIKEKCGKDISPEGIAISYSEKYSNTYRGGKLVKRQYETSPVEKITYKTIKVPKKYVASVKKQQKALFSVSVGLIDPLVMQ